MLAPGELVGMYEHRRQVERDILSSRGDATNFFVTFLDNHDQNSRFNNPGTPQEQVLMGLALLFSLQGIPSIYYGTEQGLHGSGGSREVPRETPAPPTLPSSGAPDAAIAGQPDGRTRPVWSSWSPDQDRPSMITWSSEAFYATIIS